jgi:hypothetical protein
MLGAVVAPQDMLIPQALKVLAVLVVAVEVVLTK